jgi:UDP-N-acetylglucosamine:LPS N-acetylglucosamine transferase
MQATEPALDREPRLQDKGLAPQRLRVLVLCAEVGAGHITVARTLAERLGRRPEVIEVGLRTDLDVLGERLGRFLTNSFEVHLDRIGWTYELAYRVFYDHALPRRLGQLALAVLGSRGLRRTISSFGADVVAVEYPVLSAALGELRARGRLSVPVCSSISDPAGLHYWAHPGIDLHVLSWPEAVAEVDRIAGPGRAVPVRPLVDDRFLAPPPRSEARATLGLPVEPPVILVSGGGWGLGDLAGAAQTALDTVASATVVCLSGRSDAMRRDLEPRFAGRVRVLGFTDLMPELMSAADVLVHTTGGTTALEARLVGCPLINFGTGVAHVRTHARALAQRGLAEWAPDRARLGPAIERALAARRPEPLDTSGLADAAELIVELGRRR